MSKRWKHNFLSVFARRALVGAFFIRKALVAPYLGRVVGIAQHHCEPSLTCLSEFLNDTIFASPDEAALLLVAGGGPAAGAAQGQAAAGAGQQLVQLQQLVAAEAGWVRGGEAGPGHRALRRHDQLASAEIPA